MNRVVLIAVSIVVLLGLLFFMPKRNPVTNPAKDTQAPTVSATQDAVPYTAAFAIFTNGLKRTFTASMYHHLSEDVFITTDNPEVVHVERLSLTWNDFFSTLPFTLTKECLTTGTGQTYCTGDTGTLRFYLNGQLSPDALDLPITKNDQLLVTFGNENEAQIMDQIRQIAVPAE